MTRIPCMPTGASIEGAQQPGRQASENEELGSVGSPGAPAPARISFDPEPVMNLGVGPFARQRGVLQRGLPAEDPLEKVMDVAPVMRGDATGEHAVLVPVLDRPAQ